MGDLDTDTLIALVSSLLPQNQILVTPDEIIDALIQSNGNVETAAQALQTTVKLISKLSKETGILASPGKRKRVDLDAWLKIPSKKQREPALNLDVLSNDASSSSLSVSKATSSGHEKPSKPTSVAKPAMDLMSILRRQPSQKEKGPTRLVPLTLSNPKMVADRTPCTLHPSILPPELACRLFYSMVNASKEWSKNKWWLFDRVVESPHLTSFFARKTNGLDGDESWQEAAQYWYNGRVTEVPATFPPEMEEACKIIEEVVNEEIVKRKKRYPLEWGGTSENGPIWRANVAASNCYQGSKESVGFHSDQLTYLGPYPTIASLSLGTSRNFSLREVIPSDQVITRKARTFNVPLTHNSLTIMHASCQENFKHSIPPQRTIDLFRPAFTPTPGDANITESSNCRINITFRFYRPDFRPSTIPRCHCDVPMILRPDMKNRSDGETDRYWWTCYAGAQNDGKGCKLWKVLDMEAEGRGPCIGTT